MIVIIDKKGTISREILAGFLNPNPPKSNIRRNQRINLVGIQDSRIPESPSSSTKRDFSYSYKNQNFVKLRSSGIKAVPLTPQSRVMLRMRGTRPVLFKPEIFSSIMDCDKEPCPLTKADIKGYVESVIKVEKLYQSYREKIVKNEFFSFSELDKMLNAKKDSLCYNFNHFYNFLKCQKIKVEYKDVAGLFSRVQCWDSMDRSDTMKLFKVVKSNIF